MTVALSEYKLNMTFINFYTWLQASTVSHDIECLGIFLLATIMTVSCKLRRHKYKLKYIENMQHNNIWTINKQSIKYSQLLKWQMLSKCMFSVLELMKWDISLHGLRHYYITHIIYYVRLLFITLVRMYRKMFVFQASLLLLHYYVFLINSFSFSLASSLFSEHCSSLKHLLQRKWN